MISRRLGNRFAVALAPIAMLTVVTAGCGVTDRLKRTQKSTERMDETTHEMNNTTSEMNGSIREMNRDTTAMANKMDQMNLTTAEMAESIDQMNDRLTAVERMRESTDSMRETTEGMTTSIEQMNQVTTEMKDELGEVADNMEKLDSQVGEVTADARQAAAAMIRSDAFARITENSSVEKKFAEAGKYYMAFEFQLWKEESMYEREARLGFLYLDAIREYFRTIHKQIVKANYNLSPNSNSNEMFVLYALAAIGHVNNTNLDIYEIKGNSQKAPSISRKKCLTDDGSVSGRLDSIVDLIEESLCYGREVNQGKIAFEDLPAFAKEVLIWQEDAIYLARLRVNYISGIVTYKLAQIEQSESERGGFGDEMRKITMLLKEWHPHMDVFKGSPAKLAELNEFLTEVYRERDFLINTGIELNLDGLLVKALRNMSLDFMKRPDIQQQAARSPELKEFLSLIPKLKVTDLKVEGESVL